MTPANFRLLALLLGAIALVGLVGGLVLAGFDKAVPGEITAITAGAAGALGSLYLKPPPPTSAAQEGG